MTILSVPFFFRLLGCSTVASVLCNHTILFSLHQYTLWLVMEKLAEQWPANQHAQSINHMTVTWPLVATTELRHRYSMYVRTCTYKPCMWLHPTMVSCSNSSCSEEDNVEALTFIFGIKDIKLSLETHETLKRNRRTNEELTGVRLWMEHGSRRTKR